jgi:hypothetical protein
LRERRADVERAGARLIIVGSGSTPHARHFQKNHAPGIAVFSDPSLRAYRALGMRRSVAATLGLRSLVGGVGSTLRGNLQGLTRGDPWQQGGLFVVVPGGEVIFGQRNRDPADRPRVDEALTALRSWGKPAKVS